MSKNQLIYKICTVLIVLFCYQESFANDNVLQDIAKYSKTKAKQTALRPILQQRYEKLVKSNQNDRSIHESSLNQHVTINTEQLIIVDVIAKHDVKQALRELSEAGLRKTQLNGRFISGEISLDLLPQLEKLNSINEFQANSILTQSGSVVSEGVRAMKVDLAAQNHGVDGTGISIGVISDSYDCLGGAASDIASGDLPSSLIIKEDAFICDGLSDEGRALMQIIHDIAPGARLIFLSGANGLAALANGIVDLARSEGVDIIVDDLKTYNTPFFQEDLITQAAKEAVGLGVLYITAAGNSARLSYEAPYNESINTILNTNVHDFNPGPEVDTFQQFELEEGGTIRLALQWDSLAYSINGPPGSEVDLDIYIVDESETTVLASSVFSNLGREPFEDIVFANPIGSGQTRFNFVISKVAGESPQLIKYVIYGRFAGEILEYATNSGTIVGHANSEYTLAVGAVDYRMTPDYGVSPPVLEYFSSAGGSLILFNENGDRLGVPVQTRKPDFVAPNNVNTTFFEGDDADNDGLPNFRGSSAAAPHAAGVAALVLNANNELSPKDVGIIMRNTAIDVRERSEPIAQILDEGVDDDAGYGLIDADAAVALALNYEPTAILPFSEKPNKSFGFNEIAQVTGSGRASYLLLMLMGVALLMRHRIRRFGVGSFL